MHKVSLSSTARDSHNRQQTRPRRNKRAAPRKGEANSFPVGGFTSPALAAIPNLPPDIPLEYIIPNEAREGGRIALEMLDAGLLTCLDKHASPSTMVERSMADWFATLTREIRYFQPHLYLVDDLERLTHGVDEDEVKNHFGVTSEDYFSFAISFASWQWFTLKEKCEALESKVPGLGETAILWLDRNIQPLTTAVTPNFTLYAAQYAYWYGEEDESCAIEDMVACGEAPEDVDIYRRADFDASFPKMAYEASERLDRDALQNLLLHPDREVADLAALLLEDKARGEVGGAYLQQFCEDHVPIIYPSVCVAWSENDDTVQIVDDYFNREQENGGTDYHAMWLSDKSAHGIAKMRALIEEYITSLIRIEKVLDLIATENDNI